MGEPKKLTRKPTLTSSEEAEFAALYEPPAKQPKLANPFPQSSEDAWKRKLPESRKRLRLGGPSRELYIAVTQTSPVSTTSSPSVITLSSSSDSSVITSDSSVITLSSSSLEEHITEVASSPTSTSSQQAAVSISYNKVAANGVKLFSRLSIPDSPRASPVTAVLSHSYVTDTTSSQSSSAQLSFTSPHSVPDTLSVDISTSPETSHNSYHVSETSLSPSLLSVASVTVPESDSFTSTSVVQRSNVVSDTSSSISSVSYRERDSEEDVVHSTYFVADTQTCVPDSMLPCSSDSSSRKSNEFDMSFLTDLF